MKDMNMQETEYINVYGARVHNLKDIDAEIPRNSLTVITGLSGSGKSSLAFDTIFAEGQVKPGEDGGVYVRKGSEEGSSACDEPDFVSVPYRAHGI